MLGFSTGGKWYDKINAGKENREAIMVNNTIWDGCVAGRVDFSYLKDDIKAIKNKVIKDPRFTWPCPYILKVWAKYADDLRLVLCHRNFDCVAASRTAIESSILKSTDECRETFFMFMERVLELNIPFRVLKYPDFLDQYDLVYESLSIFGKLNFNKEKGKKIWDKWVDLSKVHFQ
jgi:hypothetical protein